MKYTCIGFLIFCLSITSISSAQTSNRNLIAGAVSRVFCDGIYHWVDVPGSKSLDGTATGLQYICQNGSPNGPLLIFFEGGGSCWNGATCDCQPDAYGNCQGPNSTIADNHFDKAESFDGQRWGQEQTPNGMPLFGQTAAFAGPTSPFGPAFNYVIIPYSTGDVFAGDAVRNYTTPDGRTIHAFHRGYQNVTLDLQKAKQLFPNPSEVVVWGDSAGGVGADCNLSKLRSLWSVDMWEMSNAGPALGTALTPLFPAVTRTWGVWELRGKDVIANTCPANPPPGSTQWSQEWVIRFNATALTSVRKVFADDYSDAVIDFFSCKLGAPPDANGSCASAVTATLITEFDDVISAAQNYKVYYHSGYCHIERESDFGNPSCDFDSMIQDGVFFHDWVYAWINNYAGLENVR